MSLAWTPADWRDHYNERAAIIEFDAGMNRLEAEARAMAEVLDFVRSRLTSSPPKRRDPEAHRTYMRSYMRKRRARAA